MNYHPELVWEINKHLLVVCALIAAADVLFVALKRSWLVWKDRKVAVLQRNLHKLALSGKGAAKDAFSEIIKQTTPEEFLEIMRHEKKIWVFPEEFARGLKEYLNVSGRFAEIEKIARRSRSKWRRVQAIISLGFADDPAAMAIIQDSLKDKDEDVVYFSMLTLGQIKNDRAARLLLEVLERKPSYGNRVITLLEKFPPSVADEAMQVTGDKNKAVRFWSVKLLSRLKPERLVKKIEALAADEAPEVRSAVCECLGRIGVRGSKETVLKRLIDPVWFVRRRAVKALSRILGPECMPEIVGLIRDEHWMVRDAVKKAMTHDIKAALPYLEKIIHDDHGPLRKDCVEVLEDAGYLNVLFGDLLSRDARVKEKSVELLRGIVNSGAHIGLESSLTGFEAGSRDLVLREIAKLNEGLAEHIRQKIKHLLTEL